MTAPGRARLSKAGRWFRLRSQQARPRIRTRRSGGRSRRVANRDSSPANKLAALGLADHAPGSRTANARGMRASRSAARWPAVDQGGIRIGFRQRPGPGIRPPVRRSQSGDGSVATLAGGSQTSPSGRKSRRPVRCPHGPDRKFELYRWRSAAPQADRTTMSRPTHCPAATGSAVATRPPVAVAAGRRKQRPSQHRRRPENGACRPRSLSKPETAPCPWG